MPNHFRPCPIDLLKKKKNQLYTSNHFRDSRLSGILQSNRLREFWTITQNLEFCQTRILE